MIVLKSKDTTFGGIFYFYNMRDCEDFLYVFKDHWCNVPWEKPIEAPSDTLISFYDRKSMDVPPKKRAEDSLFWGFSLVNRLGIGLDDKQISFLNSFVNQ